MAPTSYSVARNDAVADREKVDNLVAKLNSIPWANPNVAHLVETPQPHRHALRDEVEVVAGKGFAGDHEEKSYYRGKYVPGREVSAIAMETLEILDVDPIVVGDNLITRGIDLTKLKEGDLVRIGDVLLERSWKEHRPCVTFRNRTSPEAFAAVSRCGVRGALFVVRAGGHIRRGDFIVICKSPFFSC